MALIALSWGATSESEFSLSGVGLKQLLALGDFSAEPYVDGLAGLSLSFPLTLTFDCVSDGPIDGPWPGFPLRVADPFDTLVTEFDLGLSPLGSFIFPADLDGITEVDVEDGGQGALKGMAYQDPASVDIEGGVIRNVTFSGISIDGGTF